MRFPALVLFCALAALPATGLAQSASSSPTPGAKAEKPQGISREDYIKRAADHAATRFDRMDADHDGILSRDEIHAYRETHHRTRHTSGAEPATETPPKQQ